MGLALVYVSVLPFRHAVCRQRLPGGNAAVRTILFRGFVFVPVQQGLFFE